MHAFWHTLMWELSYFFRFTFLFFLPFVICSEDELRELFSQHGDVSQVHLVVDRESKRSKGIGYVLFASPESAVRCIYLIFFLEKD